MTALPRFTPQARGAAQIIWIIAACLIGVLISQGSLTSSGAVIGIIALSICALITPFAPIVALLVIAPIRTLFATESPVQVPLDFGQWLLIIALTAWIVHRLVFRNSLPKLRPTTTFAAVTIFIVASGLSAFGAYSLSAWLTEWLKWLQIGAIILLVCDLSERRTWEWIVFGLVASGLTNALIGIYEFFGGSGAEHLLISPTSRFFRAFGTFGQPNPFGGFMGLIAPLAAAAALGYALQGFNDCRATRQLSLRMISIIAFYTGSAALISAALFLSWSRGAWLGFGVSMLIVLFAAPRKIQVGFLLLTGVLLLGGIAWASGRLPASIVERIQSATTETFSFTDVRGVDINPENYPLVERLAHWQAALNMGTAHPLLGVGLGNYEIAYPEFRLIYWKYPLGHAHNYYLNVVAETGMIGLSGYALMWVAIIIITWRTTRRQPDPLARMIAVGLLGTWSYLAIHSLTDNLYVNNLFIHLGFMLGILAALSDPALTKIIPKRVAWHKPTQSIS